MERPMNPEAISRLCGQAAPRLLSPSKCRQNAPRPRSVAGVAESKVMNKFMTLDAGATMIPHPEKARKGGEDAFFISNNGLAVGVADGVGGSAVNGVDPGQYARSIMYHAKLVAELDRQGVPESPQYMMKEAHRQTILPGSSTACIMSINNATRSLLAANIGDSGFIVMQDSQVVFQTKPQQHGFNFPFQLGLNTFVANRPEQAQALCVSVQPGDIIVAATDGLWDNLFIDECADIVNEERLIGMSPKGISESLAANAQLRALDEGGTSPFVESANAHGFEHHSGGKLDDITVVVCYVTDSDLTWPRDIL
ncbi:hypothetical protein BSKO_11517 [Bryopsis sp. KO-2023]|nr:hypothetical protein BSKO_11517 [Bryopsis sp. KO-2023]